MGRLGSRPGWSTMATSCGAVTSGNAQNPFRDCGNPFPAALGRGPDLRERDCLPAPLQHSSKLQRTCRDGRTNSPARLAEVAWRPLVE
jgi:hypothetical protein